MPLARANALDSARPIIRIPIRPAHEPAPTTGNPRPCRGSRAAAPDPRALPFLRGARLSRRQMVRSAGGQGLSLGRVLLHPVGFRTDLCLWRTLAGALARARLS